MNIEIFAEWLRHQGHQIHKTQHSYWYDQGPCVYQAFPYHWVFNPTDNELSDFLKSGLVIGLRYSAPIEAHQGSISYHAVYDKPAYGLGNLGKWARKNVRRGLKNCKVKPISFERLSFEGFVLHADTLDRQGRKLEIDREIWHNRCMAASNLPGFEAWGALVDEQLAASVITFQMDNWCYMLYQQCRREYLRDHVNNALSFIVTKTMVERPEIDSILYGLHSLDAPSSVDEFKFRMGYFAKPVRQRVIFHPILSPVFNIASHNILKSLCRWQPGNATLTKAEGMLRFYLQGKRPLSQQPWPPPLAERKVELIQHINNC
jgi:hypothetical protein